MNRRARRGEVPRYITDVVFNHVGDECLFWPFTTNNAGYAIAQIPGETSRLVSRMACAHKNGPPPTPLHEAAHSCGNGHLGCVNPNHLSWKTRKENHADKYKHGTMPLGEKHQGSKLTSRQVAIIRSSKASHVELGRRFGVTSDNIAAIRKRISWRHVP